MRVIEKAYENANKFNEEDIIATIEVIENKFGKLCNLNCEIEELSEDVEDSEEICDNSLQSEINIRKKIIGKADIPLMTFSLTPRKVPKYPSHMVLITIDIIAIAKLKSALIA